MKLKYSFNIKKTIRNNTITLYSFLCSRVWDYNFTQFFTQQVKLIAYSFVSRLSKTHYYI